MTTTNRFQHRFQVSGKRLGFSQERYLAILLLAFFFSFLPYPLTAAFLATVSLPLWPLAPNVIHVILGAKGTLRLAGAGLQGDRALEMV